MLYEFFQTFSFLKSISNTNDFDLEYKVTLVKLLKERIF